MKKRIIPILYVALLFNIFQVKAHPLFACIPYVAPTIMKVVAFMGMVGVGYSCDRIINEPKRERKRQKRIADHQEHLNQVSNWSYDQFEARFKLMSQCGEYNEIPPEYLFAQHAYYQFAEFQSLLQNHSAYEKSIIKLRDQIKHGKEFDLITEDEQNKFKDVVYALVQEIDCRKAQREYEAQRYQEWLQQERLEKERKTRYQEHINKVLSVEHNALSVACEDFANAIIHLEDYDPQVQEVLAKRHHALALHFEARDEWRAHTFNLMHDTIQLLKEQGINVNSYSQFYGNQMQFALHQEIITILDQTARIHVGNNFQDDAKPFIRSLTLFADAGHQHNHAGHLPQAISLIDFCYEMFDVAQTFYKMTGQMCLEGIKLGYRCNKAALRGAWQGSKNYGNKLLALGACCKDLVNKSLHPIETTRILAPKIKKAAKRFGQYLVECSDAREKWRAKAHNPHLYYWHIRTNQESLTIKQQRREWLDETIKDGHQMLKNTALFAYDTGLEGCIEKGSEVATEMALSYATGKAVGSLAQAGALSFANFLDELSELQYVHQMPTTMGTMQGYVALEGAELARAAAALRVLSDEFGAAGDALGKVGSAGNLLSEAGSTGDKGSIFNYPNDPIEVADATQAVQVELARIQSKFIIPITGTERIHDSLIGLNLNSCRHIAHYKHNWGRFVKDPNDYDSIFRLMTKVYNEGTFVQESKDVFLSTLKIYGEVVQVRWVNNSKGIFLGNGWIK
ncbi:MAG: hypothetical protein AB7F19_04630 [Candidatus Babeliales bacterium]